MGKRITFSERNPNEIANFIILCVITPIFMRILENKLLACFPHNKFFRHYTGITSSEKELASINLHFCSRKAIAAVRKNRGLLNRFLLILCIIHLLRIGYNLAQASEQFSNNWATAMLKQRKFIHLFSNKALKV